MLIFKEEWKRTKGGEKDVEDADLVPVLARFCRIGVEFGGQLGQVDAEKDMEVDREDGRSTLSTGTP